MRGGLPIACLLAGMTAFCPARPAAAGADPMRGPVTLRPPAAELPIETSGLTGAILGLIRLYQRQISPTTPGRCGFAPSCSVYAARAIRACGPLLGVPLAGDRLTRCNIWRNAGREYTLLPNGLFYDPVEHHLPAGGCVAR